MARRVKDIFEIGEYTSLESLIDRLQSIRADLSEGSSPVVALRGDDVFGQYLTITYLRELTQEEAAVEERYSAAGYPKRPSRSAQPPSDVRPATKRVSYGRTIGCQQQKSLLSPMGRKADMSR